ncbi:MAG TPA: DUF1801 domain-containing protein [Ornithinibacter sp.]|nr:DUF1801 domain-containing protein [Ornithinibacter sp.]
MTATPDPVQRYLDSASDAGRASYLAVRDLVLRHAPDATETLSYTMPTFVVDGSRLLHASAWKEHLSIYPLPDEGDLDPQALAELEAHSSGASTLKLPYREPFPTDLVDAVVRAHVARVAAGR